MAFAAVRGEVPPLAWLLYVANILWSTGYDTWYAMVDRDDDLRMGSKSTAILFGDLDLVALGVLYALFFVALALVGQRAGLGMYYWAGVGVAAAAGGVRVRHRPQRASARPASARSCTTTGSGWWCSPASPPIWRCARRPERRAQPSEPLRDRCACASRQ